MRRVHLWGMPILAGALLGGALGCGPPETGPATVGDRVLTPQSSAFGRAHYFKSGWFVDDNYDVWWIVVADHPDICGFMTAYNACVPGVAIPDPPRNPDGLRMDLTYNSFAENNGTIGPRESGDIELRFTEQQDGGVVFFDEAIEGSLSNRGERGDEQVWGTYRVTTDGGLEVRGGYDATRCPAMDEILEKELYDRDRCPAPPEP